MLSMKSVFIVILFFMLMPLILKIPYVLLIVVEIKDRFMNLFQGLSSLNDFVKIVLQY